MLAPGLDRPINKFLLDGNRVIMNVESEGNDKIYTIAENQVEAKPLTNNAAGCYTNISMSSNDIIVANYETAAAPPEVVRINGSQSSKYQQF
jgi:hypothetical protein